MKENIIFDGTCINGKKLEINSYLTYSQIQSICDAVRKFETWSEREQNVDVLLLHYATNINYEDIEKYGHNEFLQSGVIDKVKLEVKNFKRIYEAINYTESTQRALSQIIKEMPKIVEPLKKVIEHGNKSSKKQ